MIVDSGKVEDLAGVMMSKLVHVLGLVMSIFVVVTGEVHGRAGGQVWWWAGLSGHHYR